MSQLFTSGGQCIGASASVLPYSGLISFRMDWFYLLAVQGTLKSLLQHHTLKASCLALSLLYDPTVTSAHDHWKNHIFEYLDLCLQSDVFVFLTTLSRHGIASLPRSKHLLISWLQSPSAVILESPPKYSLSLFLFFSHLFAVK